MRFPWATALKIAARELRASAARFGFVVLAVAVGVGALTGVRGFSRAFSVMLAGQARALMAGDLSVNLAAPPDAAQRAALAALTKRDVRSTAVVETVSMVAAMAGNADTVPQPALAALKAVDPRLYPFYGSVATQPAVPLARLLDDASVLVSPDLLLRLHLKVGDPLSIGGQAFRIAGTVVSEPDRLLSGFSIGPRVLLTSAGLDRTGLIQFGSQVNRRLLLQLGPRAPRVAGVNAALRRAFPHARILDYRQANPELQAGFDHAVTFLSLISLMALIVGGVGVASAMHAHLQLRLDSVATMKVLGARTSQLVRIYGTQALLVGLAGGVVGVALSLGVERTFPLFMGRFLPTLPPLHWSLAPAAQGLAVGVLVALLFALPALLGVRHVPPAAILRRHMQEARPPLAERLRRRRDAALAGALAFVGVGAIAVGLVDAPWTQSLRYGRYFLFALAVSAAVLACVSWLMLRVLRRLVQLGTRAGKLPLALRHGLANVYRPGSQAQAVLMALGIGVAFTLSVFLLQRALVRDLMTQAPPGLPNLFLLDIPPAQSAAVRQLLLAQPGLEAPPELLPTVQAELTAVDGHAPRVPAGRGRGGRGGGRGYARTRSIAVAAGQPPGTTLLSGRWWKDAGQPGASVGESMAQELGLHVGDILSWQVADRSFTTPVTAIHRAQAHRLIAAVDFILSPAPLADVPMVEYGGARISPAAVPGLERTLYRRFPTVTVVNLAEVIERIESIVDQVATVVHFVAFFAVLAGAIILASSVAGTRFRRMREIAVLKAFGATRGTVVRIFSAEFLVLGAVAGLVGCLLASGFTNLLTRSLLRVPFHFDWLPNLICVLATAGVAVGAGWIACARILRHKPLDVLRDE